MSKRILKTCSLLAVIAITYTACKPVKKSPIALSQNAKDTLNLGYMYWANDMTPFGFGSRYSLIVLGTVTKINPPSKNDKNALYTSVEGHIVIQEAILDSKAHNRDMETIGYLETDCFENTTLVEGDQVLVFCVSYEGDYAITGRQSIIKIPTNDKRYITSLKKYIDASYDPTVIENDIDLWSKLAVGKALEEYIKTYKEFHEN